MTMDTPRNPGSGQQLATLLPYGFARSRGALVARRIGDEMEVWLREGAEPATLAEVRRILKCPLQAQVLTPEAFERALSQAYTHGENHAATLVGDMEHGMDLQQLAQDIPEVADLLESEDDAPIIRLINALLTQALRENASDIHIEPFETRSVVRFRMDGALRDVIEPKRALHAAIVSRIKVMAQLDIAEKRLPQDGRITLRLAGRPVDVRVSTLPTGHGERVVLRLLDKQAGRLELGRLGMSDFTLTGLDELIRRPHGIVLVTGPTGSARPPRCTRRSRKAGRQDAQHHDGRGPDRVRPRRHRPDPGQCAHRPELRARAARHPAAGPGRHHDRRDPRPRDRADRGAGLAHRPPGAGDAAHQRRRQFGDAPDRHGGRALPAGVEPARRARPAPGAPAVPAVPPAARAEREGNRGARTARADGPLFSAVGCPSCNSTGYRGRTGIYELLTVDESCAA
jgi:general secretion pathway protein E